MVAGAAAQESHPHLLSGLAEEVARQPHRVAEPESEQVGVEGKRLLVVGGWQYDVAHALAAGDEPVPVRADGRPTRHHGAREDLERVPRWIIDADELADLPIRYLGRVAVLHRYAGSGQDVRDLA